MAISGQGVADAKFLHEDKTGAIGERVAMIGVFAKERFCGLKMFLGNPNKSEGLAVIQDLQQPQRAVAADASFGQGAGLVNDVVRQDKANAGFQQASDAALSLNVGRVAKVSQ